MRFTCTEVVLIAVGKVTRVLLSFRVSNHRSIREEQQLLLSPVRAAAPAAGASTDPADAASAALSAAPSAVPVAALFGANAAGKSNVVDALHFMAGLVRGSHRDAEPGGGLVRTPFLLDPRSAAAPSWYVVDLVLDGVRHTYGFGVDDERVLDEWLYSYPDGTRRTVFQRSGDAVDFGEGVPKAELELVRSITEPNVLFLSVAARSRQPLVQPVYAWFRAVRFRTGGAHGSPDPGSLRRLQDPARAASVVALLRAADLGIEDMGVEDFDADGADRVSAHTFRDRLMRELRRTELSTLLFTTTTARVWVQQRARDGSSARLGLEDQSQGTRMLFDYAGPVLDALEQGSMLIVDEVDASLHPRLTAQVIRLFQSPAGNPHGAQLLLTTHDVSLLGRSAGEEILRRDQIWFAEKDRQGETTLFPLSDFTPRQAENRERRYLGGSYGAVPVLSDERFEAALAARGRTVDGEDAET
ncbi:AAA family ATPase [Streptomyces albireticuli]|uniref:AAA family ATPase n=1 Tax=Streptomyces albireticuli TaxID=1940 RepID=UPI0036CFA199